MDSWSSGTLTSSPLAAREERKPLMWWRRHSAGAVYLPPISPRWHVAASPSDWTCPSGVPRRPTNLRVSPIPAAASAEATPNLNGLEKQDASFVVSSVANPPHSRYTCAFSSFGPFSCSFPLLKSLSANVFPYYFRNIFSFLLNYQLGEPLRYSHQIWRIIIPFINIKSFVNCWCLKKFA